MNYPVSVEFFNKTNTRIPLDVQLNGVVISGTPEENTKSPSFIPTAQINSTLFDLLREASIPCDGVFISYEVYSPQLTRLIQLRADVSATDLTEAVVCELLSYIITSAGIPLPRENTRTCTTEWKSELHHASSQISKYFRDGLHISSPELDRIQQFLDEHRYREARIMLRQTSADALPTQLKSRYYLQDVQIAVHEMMSQEDMQELINERRALPGADPDYRAMISMEYIRYLENARKNREAQKELKALKLGYPIDRLPATTRALFYYLDGRNDYRSGNFIEAVRSLDKAADLLPENEPGLLASIYNTASNCFTDNLLFDQGMALAKTALVIRQDLRLPEQSDTLSLIAGCLLKSGQAAQSLEKYDQAAQMRQHQELTPREQQRALNYEIKCHIALGNISRAETLLEQSESLDVGLRFASFTHALRMALLFSQSRYDDMEELYKTTFMLPENHEAYDQIALGWGYFLSARSCFEKGDNNSGIQRLYRAICILRDDLYILEAGAVFATHCLYTLSDKELDTLFQLIDVPELIGEITTYIERHRALPEHYFVELFASAACDPHSALDDYEKQLIAVMNEPDDAQRQSLARNFVEAYARM